MKGSREEAGMVTGVPVKETLMQKKQEAHVARKLPGNWYSLI